ncbi:MAG: serine hydrolase domain-containing protein [Actinomycetota bacterium]
MVEIHGKVESGFERVREAFENNFESNEEVGAAFSLYVKGRKVVDIWGGIADETTGRPWDENTSALVFSTTKGVTAIAAGLLAQRGELDLDAPVATYWPEFKAAGKENVPVRWLLSHRVGLPAVNAKLTAEQVLAWDPIVEALAAETPFWEPGTKHGYHALTYGWLVGEVIKRASGRNIGRFVAEELATPLGLDLYIGLPESEEGRVSRLVLMAGLGSAVTDEMLEALPEEMQKIARAFTDPNSLTQRALNITTPPLDFNSRAVHAAEIPAANGIGTARSLAKLYASCVGEIDGSRLLNEDTVRDMTREQSNGPDEVLLMPTRFGTGFFLASDFAPLFGPNSFGHAGAGGSLAMADPDAQIGFGYVMNKMQQNLSGDPRTFTLVEAVKASI